MTDIQSFLKEIIGPLFWQIWDSILGRHSRIYKSILKLTADAITYIIWLSYIVYSIISFGRNVGHWYGWLTGVILGLSIAQLLGLLWPHRWHLERVEESL